VGLIAQLIKKATGLVFYLSPVHLLSAVTVGRGPGSGFCSIFFFSYLSPVHLFNCSPVLAQRPLPTFSSVLMLRQKQYESTP